MARQRSALQQKVNQQRLRVFNVVESFDGQAVETWLRKVMEVSVRRGDEVDWIFFCILPKAGREDGAMRELGAKVLHSSVSLTHKMRFVSGLRRALKEFPCDVFHCHHDVLSGLYLLASMGLPIKKRIVHVHNTYVRLPSENVLKQALGSAALRRACWRLADHIVGVSGAALDAFMGGHPTTDGRELVIPVGVDTMPYRRIRDSERVLIRTRLGIAPTTIVCLFVGRLVPEKNPQFCLQVLAEMRANGKDAVLLFVGVGCLDAALAEEAKDLGLSSQVKFLGWTDKVAEIMSAADVLLWPSNQDRKEGLGLVVVEAQAAGLAVLVSTSLPVEAVAVEELIHFCNLNEGPAAWAQRALQAVVSNKPAKADCVERVMNSRVELVASAEAVLRLYG